MGLWWVELCRCRCYRCCRCFYFCAWHEILGWPFCVFASVSVLSVNMHINMYVPSVPHPLFIEQDVRTTETVREQVRLRLEKMQRCRGEIIGCSLTTPLIPPPRFPKPVNYPPPRVVTNAPLLHKTIMHQHTSFKYFPYSHVRLAFFLQVFK